MGSAPDFLGREYAHLNLANEGITLPESGGLNPVGVAHAAGDQIVAISDAMMLMAVPSLPQVLVERRQI